MTAVIIGGMVVITAAMIAAIIMATSIAIAIMATIIAIAIMATIIAAMTAAIIMATSITPAIMATMTATITAAIITAINMAIIKTAVTVAAMQAAAPTDMAAGGPALAIESQAARVYPAPMTIADQMTWAATRLLAGGLLLALPLTIWTGSHTQAAAGDPIDPAADHRTIQPIRRIEDPTKPYWEGFELKNEGDCQGAITRLRPIATLGRGYEAAQHALGICLMRLGGLPAGAGTPPDRLNLTRDSQFTEGLDWVLRAAQAGSFQAQRTLLALYAARLGPDEDPVETAKWLHLYKVNPMRLSLGAQAENIGALDTLENRLPQAALLEGKARAQRWTPAFWTPQSTTAIQ